MSAISDYNAACNSAQTAISASQYAAALQHLERAWALQLMIPDSEMNREKLTFPREGIQNAIAHLKKRATETGQLKPANGMGSLRFTDMVSQRG